MMCVNNCSYNVVSCLCFPLIFELYTVKPVYKSHSREPETVPFMYSLKVYALFINVKNETVLSIQ
jgi:hypothetical protein